MAKITYLSHAAFQIETQSHKLLVDPYLTGNPLAPVKQEDVTCDYILLTHGHADHIGDTVEIAARNKALVIANYEVAAWCAHQGLRVHAMHIGGAHEFPFGRVKLTIAHHGSGYQAAGDEMIYMGNPAGLLITVEGKTIYHAGDTGLFYDMKLIGQMNMIDLALLPIGDNFTMGIDDAVKAAEFLQPKRLVPMHYDTFEVIQADPEAFAQKAAASGFKSSLLKPGEAITI